MIERLESSFQQIRQFSTDVSHELRTPITAIRGQLEVALFTAQTVDQYRDATLNSLQDVERLSQIVRALLLLSQAESGQLALQKTRLDLSAVVRDIVDQFQIPAEGARVELSADLPPECPADLDRVQIERMLSNLLSNSLKFTPARGRVHVALRSSPEAIAIVVEDTGYGIPEEHIPHIFERFYRVPAQETCANPEPGLGLGLSFVAWIAKAHGGTIQVDSAPGKGARFTISLPATAAETAAVEPVPATEVMG
jgi:signal transduction histidine kinase